MIVGDPPSGLFILPNPVHPEHILETTLPSSASFLLEAFLRLTYFFFVPCMGGWGWEEEKKVRPSPTTGAKGKHLP